MRNGANGDRGFFADSRDQHANWEADFTVNAFLHMHDAHPNANWFDCTPREGGM